MSGTSAGSTGGSGSSGTGAASTSTAGGTTIQGTTFDLKQKAPKAETSGWTRSEREKLTNDGLVKFKENVVKKVIKTPLSANLCFFLQSIRDGLQEQLLSRPWPMVPGRLGFSILFEIQFHVFGLHHRPQGPG